jgi:hypothetical protein
VLIGYVFGELSIKRPKPFSVSLSNRDDSVRGSRSGFDRLTQNGWGSRVSIRYVFGELSITRPKTVHGELVEPRRQRAGVEAGVRQAHPERVGRLCAHPTRRQRAGSRSGFDRLTQNGGERSRAHSPRRQRAGLRSGFDRLTQNGWGRSRARPPLRQRAGSRSGTTSSPGTSGEGRVSIRSVHPDRVRKEGRCAPSTLTPPLPAAPAGTAP